MIFSVAQGNHWHICWINIQNGLTLTLYFSITVAIIYSFIHKPQVLKHEKGIIATGKEDCLTSSISASHKRQAGMQHLNQNISTYFSHTGAHGRPCSRLHPSIMVREVTAIVPMGRQWAGSSITPCIKSGNCSVWCPPNAPLLRNKWNPPKPIALKWSLRTPETTRWKSLDCLVKSGPFTFHVVRGGKLAWDSGVRMQK